MLREQHAVDDMDDAVGGLDVGGDHLGDTVEHDSAIDDFDGDVASLDGGG